jgi:RND superfamily putative drug exporter
MIRMRRWAEFVLAHRKMVVLFWVLVMVLGGAASGPASDRLKTDWSLPGEPGAETSIEINKLFGNGGYQAPYLATITLPEGQTLDGRTREVSRAFDAMATDVPRLRILHEGNTGDDAFRTDDDRTAYAIVFYNLGTAAAPVLPTEDLERSLEAAAPNGASVGLTGEDMLAQGEEPSGPGVLVEVILGAVGALAVLAFVFASTLALLPLVVAAGSILASFLMLLGLTYLGDMNVLMSYIIALIGLGVAIDYSLLLVTRWREERDHGRTNHDAVVAAMLTAGRAVVVSGVTVAIGLIALVVLDVPFLRSIGIGGALIPLASVAATLTITPALLGGIGPRADWPRLRHESQASRGWTAWARTVVRFRWVAAVGALAALAVLVAVFSGIKLGLASTDSLADSGPAHDTLVQLTDGGVAKGNLSPIEVLVEKSNAQAAAAELETVNGIDRALLSNAPSSSRDGQTVLVLIPEHETVNTSSVDVVEDVIARAANVEGVRGVTGVGASQIDFTNAVYSKFWIVLGIIALLTFVLLARAFRSLLLPLKAVVFNLLSLAAVYGLVVLFWQEGHGSGLVFDTPETGAITFWVPIVIFAFLYGLSMDYEVFILARMREEYDATGSTTQAVIRGIGRTGRLVTSAALILFLAFAALAAAPVTDLRVMATGLGFGILIDATIIRSLLLPSLVSLFGKWNWYMPDWAARILRVPPSRPVSQEEQPVSVPVR